MFAVTEGTSQLVGPDGRPIQSTQVGTTGRDALNTLAHGAGPAGPVALATDAGGRLVPTRPTWDAAVLSAATPTGLGVTVFDGAVRAPVASDFNPRAGFPTFAIPLGVGGYRRIWLRIAITGSAAAGGFFRIGTTHDPALDGGLIGHHEISVGSGSQLSANIFAGGRGVSAGGGSATSIGIEALYGAPYVSVLSSWPVGIVQPWTLTIIRSSE